MSFKSRVCGHPCQVSVDPVMPGFSPGSASTHTWTWAILHLTTY